MWSTYVCQYLVTSLLEVKAILTNISWNIIVVFYFYFPDYGAAFSYTCWLLICLIWGILTVHVFIQFFIVILDFCYQAVEFLIFWGLTPYQVYDSSIFLPFCRLPFHFCWLYLLMCRSFQFDSLIYLFMLHFRCQQPQNHCQGQLTIHSYIISGLSIPFHQPISFCVCQYNMFLIIVAL